jgi:hypothetical protein|nr:MAG TPA: hypothetical protein [Bacteriophage sp.]
MKYTTYENKPYLCNVKRKQRCSLPKLRTRYPKGKDEKVKGISARGLLKTLTI